MTDKVREAAQAVIEVFRFDAVQGLKPSLTGTLRQRVAALAVALESPTEGTFREGVEAAADEAWSILAAHACDTIPLSLADDVAKAICALDPAAPETCARCGEDAAGHIAAICRLHPAAPKVKK